MVVKICGITRLEDAELATELGASMVGFIFWPGSPRYVDPFRARDLVRSLPPSVTPVGVFVDQPLEHVRGIAGLVKLGAIQLHGNEPSDYAARLPYRVIRAVAVTDRAQPAAVVATPAHLTLLVDAHDPVRVGGTGRTVDWGVAAVLARNRRVILSGGLKPENVRQAIRTVGPWGVDVASGVESRPGVKDPVRLRAFFEAVRTTVPAAPEGGSR
jgi:phosphoribosylanthranilate isomerase